MAFPAGWSCRGTPGRGSLRRTAIDRRAGSAARLSAAAAPGWTASLPALAAGGAPVWAGEDRDDSAPPGSGTAADPISGGEKLLRVLIVEDEAIVALSLAAVVEQFGHEVAGLVATGRGAIAEAARLEPDLVLMDVRLADGFDGISAAERIQAERPVALVFLTAYSDQETVARIHRLGADVLSKPVGAEALRKAIEAARAGGPTPSGRGSN